MKMTHQGLQSKLLRKPAYLVPSSYALTNVSEAQNPEIEELLKRTNYYAQFTAEHINGNIWWENSKDSWACEIWVNQRHADTLMANHLPTLLDRLAEMAAYDQRLVARVL